jgi:hypothetical protein
MDLGCDVDGRTKVCEFGGILRASSVSHESMAVAIAWVVIYMPCFQGDACVRVVECTLCIYNASLLVYTKNRYIGIDLKKVRAKSPITRFSQDRHSSSASPAIAKPLSPKSRSAIRDTTLHTKAESSLPRAQP